MRTKQIASRHSLGGFFVDKMNRFLCATFVSSVSLWWLSAP